MQYKLEAIEKTIRETEKNLISETKKFILKKAAKGWEQFHLTEWDSNGDESGDRFFLFHPSVDIQHWQINDGRNMEYTEQFNNMINQLDEKLFIEIPTEYIKTFGSFDAEYYRVEFPV